MMHLVENTLNDPKAIREVMERDQEAEDWKAPADLPWDEERMLLRRALDVHVRINERLREALLAFVENSSAQTALPVECEAAEAVLNKLEGAA